MISIVAYIRLFTIRAIFMQREIDCRQDHQGRKRNPYRTTIPHPHLENALCILQTAVRTLVHLTFITCIILTLAESRYQAGYENETRLVAISCGGGSALTQQILGSRYF